MKKLLLILIGLPMIGFGQKTYVPDDVFEFYLEGQGLGDSIAFNDSVFTHLISQETFLSVVDIGISDMTGIEDFISLTTLWCYRNSINEIDVSNNILLTQLIVAENNLTKLDLSNNTLLSTLEVHDNLLDSLDLKNQPLLSSLVAYRNNLSYLDLRSGTTIPMSLNAVENSNLYCIDVDNVNLANLMWTVANNNIDSVTSFSSNCATALGCTDSTTCNYNAAATIDDGSCILSNCVTNITQNTFYTVIQTAIDSSVNGDTIIVSPGTYVENINFNGKNIVLASEFLFNNDTSYISSTIIDGNQNGSVVIFENGEDTTTVLSGFTIQNGYTYINGGGIHCKNSSPTLSSLIIKNNTAFINGVKRGGGLFFQGSSSKISNSYIMNNTSYAGGGFYIFYGCDLTLTNLSILNNYSLDRGGAISIQGSPSTIDIVNNTVSGNSCYHGGGIQCESSNNNITINNSIFYNNYSLLNNSPSEIELELTSLNNVISVSNSNIYGSEAGIVGGYVGTINWANTNIDVDPLFNDPVNGDYRLSNFSPCIGAGLDTSIIPTTDILGNPRPNPAGSNTDMGAYENALALPDVLGCMDSLATNYNASANISDSSCTNCYATADIGADTISGCDSVLISTNTITNGSYSWITSDISTLGIGDTYQGGIVFYLDSLGGGLIAAPFDQSIGGHEWGCSFDTISGANGTSFGTGAQNTIDIVNANCTPFTPGYGIAANVCDTLTLGGYSDWFLPSKDELNEMYSNKNSIGGFVNSSHYWSSSEANNTSAWTHHFAGWGSSQSGKLSNLEVRAIRAFQPINPDTTNSVMVSTSGWNYVTVTDSLGCTAMDSVYVIVNTSGCTDPSAGNYDINATCDDGSCCYADTSYTNITACDSVVWNGVTYDSSGQFTFMPDFMQIGQDIDGEAYDDHSGKSVSISADGNIVAIGAFLNDGNGSNSGHVRVYESVGGSWSQIGQDIDGESPGDLSGRSVSISDDGNIVAIGAIGNDGNGSNSGHVRIYQNIGGSWSQIGGDIDGEAADDASGYSVSLNSDGNTVAIGARLNDGDGGNSGHVRIYNYNGSSWNQLGQDIDGSGGSQSGYSVSLCADGSIVAIGAPYSYHQGYQDAGHVRMYENVSGSWQQIGSDIFGDNASDLLGFSVSLSNNGETVAVGAPTMGSTATSLGYVRIFDNIGGSWIQIGQDIDAEVPYSGHGSSVSLNSDGNKV
ncbi:hypothetical protein OAC83_02155, partial [Flavobacteriales bacterium]|nr:hypothetical protein [Flavobacteriales bacterium]